MKSVIRNFISKMIAGRSDDGIMITLSDPRKVDFQAAMLEDLLMRNGIDPRAITNETQLKNIINQIKAAEAQRIRNIDVSGIKTIESGKVFDMEGKQIPRGSDIMGGKAVPGTSDRERVRNEMKKKYGFTDERLDEIENTQFDEKIADDLLREDDERIIKERLEKQNKDSVQRFKNKMDDPEEFADGGRIGLLAGSVPKVLKLLKNKKRVQQAVDDIFPTGDYKYDAQMAADALVENNPKTFGGKLYEDLDMDTQMEVYGAVLQPITNKMATQMKLQRATKPEKTLASMEEGKGIDMSDPEIADEFGRFMKETDPEGYKKLEQTVELSNFDPKGRKKNATGGRIGYKLGAGKKGVQALLDLVRNKFGKKSITTADKAPIPPKSLERDMFKKAEERFNKTDSDIYEDNLKNLKDLGAPKLAERFRLKRKYPGITDDLLDKILIDDNMQRKAEVLATIDEVFKMMEKGKGTDEILDTMKNVTRTKQADGGITRIGLKGGLSPSDYLKVKDMLEHYHKYKKSGKPRISKADFAREFFRENNADGGRIGLAGGGMGRRGFLKLLGSLGAGAAALKTGILGLGGKQAGKEVVKEVAQSAGSGTPPPYFFKLVDKIKTMGDDILATQDKAIAKKYKDYIMEEDFAGNITIIKKNMDDPYPEEVIMSYKVDDVPIKGKKGSTKVEEYEEYTARPDMDGKMKDIEDGVPDEVVEEGTMFEDTMTEFGKTKKASGGIARMLGE